MFESTYANLTLELFLGFIGLLIAVKIIGKRQVQQVSPFDFVSAVVLGELLGNAIYNDETTIFHIFYALSVWTLLLIFIEKVVQKSRKARSIIEGSPKFIIKKGIIDYDVLKKEKLDFDELISLLRGRDVFSIREVEYAIVEPNGIMTVIKKPPFETATRNDLNISLKPSSFSLPIIMDGEIEAKNLKATGHDKEWLVKKLKQNNVKKIAYVMYAEWNQTDGIYIQEKPNDLR